MTTIYPNKTLYGNTRVPVRSQGRERQKSDQKSINSQKYKKNGFQRTSYILTICNFTKYWKRQKKEPIFFLKGGGVKTFENFDIDNYCCCCESVRKKEEEFQ